MQFKLFCLEFIQDFESSNDIELAALKAETFELKKSQAFTVTQLDEIIEVKNQRMDLKILANKYDELKINHKRIKSNK